jgi:hypothetical protein
MTAADDGDSELLSHEITLEVDGDSIPVQLEEPGPISKLEMVTFDAGVAGFLSEDANGVADDIKNIVDEVSDFPVELLDELPMEQFNQLVSSCAAVFEGKEPTIDNKHPDTADTPFEADNDTDSQFFE